MSRKPHGAGTRDPESEARDPRASRPGTESMPESGAIEDLEAVAAEAAPPRAQAETEAVDYRDRWLRTEADLQNFRRRAQRDLEESVRFAEDRLLLESIEQLDDLERALEAAGASSDAWVKGVRMVASRMTQDLERRGVTAIEPLGKPFDPESHEALLEIDAPEDTEPGTVVQVIRKGYQRNGRALRAARVVVARLPETDPA